MGRISSGVSSTKWDDYNLGGWDKNNPIKHQNQQTEHPQTKTATNRNMKKQKEAYPFALLCAQGHDLASLKRSNGKEMNGAYKQTRTMPYIVIERWRKRTWNDGNEGIGRCHEMAVVESGKEGVHRLHPRKRDVGSCPCRPNQCLCAALSTMLENDAGIQTRERERESGAFVILVDEGKGEVLSGGEEDMRIKKMHVGTCAAGAKGSSCLFSRCEFYCILAVIW